jgi:ABC-type ATPase with predicted acetyltransferase domain
VDRRVPGNGKRSVSVWVCPMPECSTEVRSTTAPKCPDHGIVMVRREARNKPISRHRGEDD